MLRSLEGSKVDSDRYMGLDYLRGVCAVLVMLYHYSTEYIGVLPASNFLARMGIYAVGIFFVLSGVSLTVTYAARLASWMDVAGFFIRRFFRLAPLYAFLILLNIFVSYVQSVISGSVWQGPPFTHVLANLSLLFGVFRMPYLLAGGWSLGAEVVYYLLFPILVWWFRWSRQIGTLLVVFLIGTSLFVSQAYVLSPSRSLDDQWGRYTHPIVNLPLFCAGVVLGLYIPKLQNWRFQIFALLGGVGLLSFAPSGVDSIDLVTGTSRLVFCFGSTLVVVGASSRSAPVPKAMHSILVGLGNITYSLYLIHWVVLGYCVNLSSVVSISRLVEMFIAAFLSFLMSVLTYRYIEIPGSALGRLLLKKIFVLQ